MPDKQSDVVSRFQQLAADASAQQVKLVQQYAGMFQKFLSGETTAVDPATATQFWMDEASNYTQRVAELSLRAYNELFDLNRALAERYLKLVTSGTGAKAAAKPAAAPMQAAAAPGAAKRRARARRARTARTATK
jgi:hypothetical protein